MARRILLGVLFGVVVYAGIVIWADFDHLREALRNFPLWLLPVACALSFLNYVLRFWKWERYRKLLEIELTPGTSFLIYLAGFSMSITPGKMGEVFKSWLIRKVNGTRIHRSAPMVVAERYTDLLAYLILVAVSGIATRPDYRGLFFGTLALCVVALFLAGSARFSHLVSSFVARLPYLWRLAPKVRGSFESTRILLSPREIILPTLISVVSWGCECTAFWLIANALIDEGSVPFLFAVFAYSFSAVAGAVLVIFPGGLGITEFSMGKLLRLEYQSVAGLAKEAAQVQAVGAILLTRLCTLWFAVGVGLVATAIFQRHFGHVDYGDADAPGD